MILATHRPFRFYEAAILLLATVLVIGLIGCGRGKGQPNILVITIDTLRADHLSIYGYKERQTPNIDRLAQDGAVFDSAHCDVTWTTPSMASTWTGTFAYKHRLRSNFDVLGDDNITAAEILKGRGYKTAAVIGSYPLDSIYHLDQGFDVYNDEYTVALFTGADASKGTQSENFESRRGATFKEQQALNFKKARLKSRRTDEEVTDAALEQLRSYVETDGPFFLWVHYFGPHSVPNANDKGLEGFRRHLDTYADKVVTADTAVGRLLDGLQEAGMKDNTVVILHADHGESLGEHSYVGHGVYLYEDNLRVPLILRWPGQVPAETRFPQLVGNIDIAPTIEAATRKSQGTILERIAATLRSLAGNSETESEGSRQMDGRSLFDVIFESKTIHEQLYAETYMPAHPGFAAREKLPNGKIISVGARRYGVFSPPWKYVVTEPYPLYGGTKQDVPAKLADKYRKTELFNIDDDPGELTDVSSEKHDQVERMRELLDEHLRRSTELDHDVPGHIDASTEHTEKLRSLGYLD